MVPASSASISLLRLSSPTPERLDERWLDVEFVGFRSHRHGAHSTGVLSAEPQPRLVVLIPIVKLIARECGSNRSDADVAPLGRLERPTVAAPCPSFTVGVGCGGLHEARL